MWLVHVPRQVPPNEQTCPKMKPVCCRMQCCSSAMPPGSEGRPDDCTNPAATLYYLTAKATLGSWCQGSFWLCSAICLSLGIAV